MKGLLVFIYKNGGVDFSNGGISSNITMCLLVGEGVPNVFEAGDLPIVTIIKRELCGSTHLTAYPVDEKGEPDRNTMFGGCFIYSSDSRFSEISMCPVPLHDRKE